MLIKIVLAVVLILAVLAVVIALQPAHFRVERSAAIAAPPSVVFAQVNDLHRFQDWSPWAKKDPACQMSFDGPTAGEGAAMAWAGNREVGEGRMSVTDSRPDESVRFKLEFFKPFAATNTTEFTFQPQAGATVVTWGMTGEKNFFFKAIGLVVSCDKMCGADFEKGLASMKRIAEAAAQNSMPSAPAFTSRDLSSSPALVTP